MWLVGLTTAFGQSSGAPAESRRVEAEQVRPHVPPDRPFKFLALVQAKGALTNIVSTNAFLDGQVLGTLGGSNGMTVDPAVKSSFIEYRTVGFASWRPDVLNGQVGLSAAFEIDFAFGDRSYGVGGNTGGGFGGDHVNLQTRRLHLDIYPRLGKRHRLHVVVGLQFVADSASDPTATTPDGLFRSGGRLMFFGSEAAGVSAYGSFHDGAGERLRYRLGGYTLLELGLGTPDDVTLWMADATVTPVDRLEIGAHAWLLRDQSGGAGGALGTGPSSALAEMQGGRRLNPYGDDPRPEEGAGVDALLGYVAVDAGYNSGLTRGPFGVHGIGLFNLGSVKAREAGSLPVSGQLFDLEARLRWAPGKGSIFRVEGLYSTPDNDDNTDAYSGVITGNSYGFAGAINNTHGTRLLFSDPQSINRMTPAIFDVAAGGLGVLAVTSSLAWDIVPSKVNTKLGFGTALAPQRESIGTELNLQISHEPWPFFNYYAAAAVLRPGSRASFTDDAWVGYVGLEWLAF